MSRIGICDETEIREELEPEDLYLISDALGIYVDLLDPQLPSDIDDVQRLTRLRGVFERLHRESQD